MDNRIAYLLLIIAHGYQIKKYYSLIKCRKWYVLKYHVCAYTIRHIKIHAPYYKTHAPIAWEHKILSDFIFCCGGLFFSSVGLSGFSVQTNPTEIYLNLRPVQTNSPKICLNLWLVQTNPSKIYLNLQPVQINPPQIYLNLRLVQINPPDICLNLWLVQAIALSVVLNGSCVETDRAPPLWFKTKLNV
jgi:hypothetical protein